MVASVFPKYEDKKVPSYLKGLVETHARALGDVERLARLAGEIQAALDRARLEAEASARLIERFDSELASSVPGIQPKHAWRQRYGERGAMREFILELLRRAHPLDVPTGEIAVAVMARFRMDFPLSSARHAWVKNSLCRALKAMAADGRIGRTHDPNENVGLAGRWFWVDPAGAAGGTAEMAAQAAAAGVEVDDEPEAGA
jgi:hypothetical protein